MPLQILHQIQYLCKKINKVEWSGALFYTTEGNIEEPSTFKIILKTILPLDMGSQAYTEYNLDDRFMDFIEEDFEERCTWKLGHIHSHNTMEVFFSGTDMKELNDNAPAHNFYLSLIVNNAMDFMAKVAFTAEAEHNIDNIPYTAKNAQGENYVIQKQDFKISTKKLFTYDCEIITPMTKVSVDDQFISQVAKIMMPKPKPVPPANSRIMKGPVASPYLFDMKSTKKAPKVKPFEDWAIPSAKSKSNLFDLEEQEEEEMFDNDEDALRYLSIYNFTKSLFNHTTSTKLGEEEEDLDIEEVLDILEDLQLSPTAIATRAINLYGLNFSKHFPEASATDFIQYTHEVLDILEDFKMQYPEIILTIKTITSMINKFITHETNKHLPTK